MLPPREQIGNVLDNQVERGDIQQGQNSGHHKPEAQADCHRNEELGLETALQQ